MFGITLDPKMILIAAGVALAVLLGVGAFLYYEGTTAALRADLEKSRAANAQATERNGRLETLVRESAAEVEAANRMAAAAKAQAERNNCVAASFDRARNLNRKALRNAQQSQESKIVPCPYGCEPQLDTRPLWGRLNELFGLCGGETCPLAGGSASTPSLPTPGAP